MFNNIRHPPVISVMNWVMLNLRPLGREMLTLVTQYGGSIDGKYLKSVSVSFLERLLTLHKHKKGVDSFFQKLSMHSTISFFSVYQNNILPRSACFPSGTTVVNFCTATQQKPVAARCF